MTPTSTQVLAFVVGVLLGSSATRMLCRALIGGNENGGTAARA